MTDQPNPTGHAAHSWGFLGLAGVAWLADRLSHAYGWLRDHQGDREMIMFGLGAIALLLSIVSSIRGLRAAKRIETDKQ